MRFIFQVIIYIELVAIFFAGNTIARKTIPSICLQPPPRSEGVCTIEIEGFYFEPRLNDCQMYVVGGCRGSPGQSFGSVDDCRATCILGTRRIQDLQTNE